MSVVLYDVLDTYRQHAHSTRELGTYFEDLVKVYFENDDLQTQHYDKIWTYADWIAERGQDESKADTGIDLVAKLRGTEDDYCAIQCKFYDAAHHLQRPDIDSFFSASGRKPFVRRILIDTTAVPLGKNAQALFEASGQYVESQRIGLSQLEESRIDWGVFTQQKQVVLKKKKSPYEHQRQALEAARDGFVTADRGKFIMACGTGKTYTGLIVAEALAGKGGRVLFMVPSLALMAQTVTEWSNDAQLPLRCFAVCSDTQVGKRVTDDVADLNQHDLAFPATTSGEKIAAEATPEDPESMTVVFSTYQSIQAITAAQKQHGLPAFDLIICDEAHRTTGVTLSGDDDSNFVRIHENAYVEGKKRLYMTATPRIYGDNVKGKANEGGHELASMDDKNLFGEVLFYRGFSWAVENHHLTDYKVIVLAMDEGLVATGLQKALAADNELLLDDASRIVGCYKALTKETLKADISYDAQPMRRALAFCKDIKTSKMIEAQFTEVVEEYLAHYTPEDEDAAPALECEIRHVDGTFKAKDRTQLLDWLKAPSDENECRILTNARCLSEGVDVPALDAIMFLHPRKSQIDVVQSVGRVMRKAEGKKMGYVILPIGVPAGVPPEQALNDNEKYKVVWQILNALRAHDERFDALINKAGLGEDVSGQIEIIGINQEELNSITAEVDNLPSKSSALDSGSDVGGKGNDSGDDTGGDSTSTSTGGNVQFGLNFNEDVSEAILAKIVAKCGTRDYWEDWATDIADIASKHITRIHATLADSQGKARAAFDAFLAELRDDLNNSITEEEAVEMLAQHLITRPVFETLFEGHQFTKENPVSNAIQNILDVLEEHAIDKETKPLEKFYESVKRRAKGVETAHGKQRLVVELYDKFFRSAFPRLTKRLGIVYTPVEVVDFIIHSVNDVLQSEFGQTLGSKGVHIIDPFTGTGTFVTRLLQSGLIKPEELEHKYKHEIHANEIVLLAYYIAAINIEAVYHDISNTEAYTPFEGICLTDTFEMYESEDMIAKLLANNSERRKRQKKLDLKVIMGNPPYSSGDKDDDGNKNISYKDLDNSIAQTYVASSLNDMGKSKVYDSYIRAIRWGSNRLRESGDIGVLAFVTGSAWVERGFADGMRKSLTEEFSSIYVLHLRGDVRKDMLSKGRAGEGGNIFDSGSMTGIAITIFVKNPSSIEKGNIYFHDIGSSLSTSEKKQKLVEFFSVNGVDLSVGWQKIKPNNYLDWLSQRNESFHENIAMGDKKKKEAIKIFELYSMGIKSNRDIWTFNSSRKNLHEKIDEMICFYNQENERVSSSIGLAEELVNRDKLKIKWTSDILSKLSKGWVSCFFQEKLTISMYRPFSKNWYYNDADWSWTRHLMPKIFPHNDVMNRVIIVSGVGARAGFSALMVNELPCLDIVEKGQCFPLKLYEPAEESEVATDWIEQQQQGEIVDGYRVKDGITDAGLQHFQEAYPGEAITKEDIFYYVYGLLHSEDYRERYADNLSKELPRMPRVKEVADFWAFVDAGRALGELHINYEQVDPYPVGFKVSRGRTYENLTDADFRVDKKWKYGGKAKDKDRTTVQYNKNITMTGIPLEAYEYVVNGRPALEWVMERQVVKTDKASGIVNDANDFAIETMGDAAYPLKLFQRLITVSLESRKIVNSLPPLGEFYG